MTKPSALGRLIRSTRSAKNMTLREFARRIGKSPTFIVMLEKDPVAPSVSEETLKAISDVLTIELDQLLALSGRIPEDLRNATPQELALYRRVKELSKEDQMDLLRQLSRGTTDE